MASLPFPDPSSLPPPGLRRCPTCKALFVPAGAHHVYCTPICRPTVYKPTPRTEKTCVNCGKLFMALRKQVACSEDCRKRCERKRYLAKHKPIERMDKICAYCKREFKGKKHQKYCSTLCRTRGTQRPITVPKGTHDSIALTLGENHDK